MPAGFSSTATPKQAMRRGRLLLPESVPLNPEQQCMQDWIDAGQRCPAFHDLVLTGLGIEKRVRDVLALSGPVGADHGAQLRLMSLSLSSLLLDDAALKAAHKACPTQGWLDPKPGRVAWPLHVGAGKTLLSASLCRAVADIVAKDPDLKGHQSRGLLYSASTVQLLGNMLAALDLMGVPREAVGVFHTLDGSEIPSIDASQIQDFPILLVTQQRLQACSAREGADPDQPGVRLQQLLEFRGKDRLTVWDEAFRSALADSAEVRSLVHATGLLREELNVYGGIRGAKGQTVLDKERGKRVLGVLTKICQSAVAGSEKREEKAPTVRAERFRIPSLGEIDAEIFQKIGANLANTKAPGPGEALEALGLMAAAGGLDVHLLRSRRDDRAVVRPRVVISDRLQRLVVLDAGYRTSLISRMDPTLKLATGADYAGRALEAKKFSNVTINCYLGPSGRGRTGEGLDNNRARTKLIDQQVARIARVPLGEKSLVVTFNRRGRGTDFKAEIEIELDRSCPGWNDTVDGGQRVTVICWGEHVGLNDWRDCRHLFFVGVLRRSWVADLRSEVFAVSRGDAIAMGSTDPALIEANQAAEEIMQAIGRGNARATIDGEAGRMAVHLPYKESKGFFAGSAPCEGSPLYNFLKQMMPGCHICSESEPPRASGAETVARAAELALDDLTVDRISSTALKPLVMAKLHAGGVGITDEIYKNGLKILFETNRLKAAEGAACWIKTASNSRTWERKEAPR